MRLPVPVYKLGDALSNREAWRVAQQQFRPGYVGVGDRHVPGLVRQPLLFRFLAQALFEDRDLA